MNDDNDFLARYDITKYDKAVYHIKACDFLIWKEFENQTLYKDYLLPTKDIKEEMKSILLEIENLAKKTIVERTPESYATYKIFLKDKYEHFIKNFYSHDVSRINFGEYSLRLISDVLCNGRTFYNSHPVNIEGNKILFNVFSRYKYVVLFDVETTGLDPNNDDIIQFACERYSLTNKDVEMIDHNNIYITLQNGKNIPAIIEKLTNISNETLSNKGIPRSEAREIIRKIFQPTEKTLFVAYNAHFDISFIEKLLDSDNIILHNIDFYDPYVTFTNIPFWYDSSNKIKHFENKKLETIIKMLNINAKNSHNACDDCHALFEIMKKLEECGMGNYIIKYINCLYLPEIESFTLPQIKYSYST